MRINRFAKAALMIGVAIFLAAATANATIVYSTTPSTQFGSGGLTLNSASGAPATLVFTPNGSTTVSDPTFINYGLFDLTCAGGCTGGATFSAFTFNLWVTDVSQGNLTGQFVGTSAGGTVSANSSTVFISWVPLSLTLGTDTFQIFSPTPIVAPNTGVDTGTTTVQGFVSSSAVPEPMTFVLIGSGLLVLGLVRRKARS